MTNVHIVVLEPVALEVGPAACSLPVVGDKHVSFWPIWEHLAFVAPARVACRWGGGVWVKYPPLVAGHDNGALYLRDFGLYVGIGQDAGNERLERATCQAANNTSADRPAKTSWRLGVLRGST